MNKFYYLDHSKLDIFNYEIETDMTYEQLCKFINKKALEFCEESDIDQEMYLNGEIEDEIVLEIEIKNKIYYFNFYSALQDISDVLKINQFKPKKIKVSLEQLI
jgi:hypothetical protein